MGVREKSGSYQQEPKSNGQQETCHAQRAKKEGNMPNADGEAVGAPASEDVKPRHDLGALSAWVSTHSHICTASISTCGLPEQVFE